MALTASLAVSLPSLAAPPAAAQAETAEPTISEMIDKRFEKVVGGMASVLFWSVFEVDKEVAEGEAPQSVGFPLVVLILLFGGLFFTFFHKFLNFRGFKHAIDVVRGKYDNPDDPGEVSHFQALTAALSATVGLGNIAGVAVAVGAGGPGAVVWMIIIGLFGMSAKFHECTLGQLYRQIDADGTVHGGPMYYLRDGLAERGMAGVGKVLSVVFAILCIGGSFGGGNMFQANQSYRAIADEFPAMEGQGFIFGVVLAILVGLVIIGGIKRIGEVTEKLIPAMCILYVVAALIVLGAHASMIPEAFGKMFSEALSLKAGIGGLLGVMVQGIKRAVFSNEAGVGSAAIAHSAAKTDEPVREGLVALLEPFIDTVVICTMTGLVVVVTGAYANPEAGAGVNMTRWAFSDTLSWFPTVLSLCVVAFAYSTLISWSYYGEKAWGYLFGRGLTSILVYKGIFLVFVVIGCVSSLQNVVDFSDMMILSMAIPNIIGGVLLAPKVKEVLADYWGKLERQEFKIYK